jgi:glucokinase
VTVLDPEMIVFGGGLSREGEALLSRVREVVYRIVPVRPEIVVSALGEDAQLYGAVLMALEAAGLRPARRRQPGGSRPAP